MIVKLKHLPDTVTIELEISRSAFTDNFCQHYQAMKGHKRTCGATERH